MSAAAPAALPGAARPVAVPIWLFAAGAALLLHGGAIALFVVSLHAADPDDAQGAPAVEIALDLAAPHVEPTDLPPGPESDASTASPPVPEQKATAEQSALPKDTPTETENPDRVVAPDTTAKPKDDDPKVKTVETTASAESVASEATAPPASATAPESPRSTAPVQGTGQAAARIRATWEKELVGHLNRFKRYPEGANRRSVEIAVLFTLDRTGHVLSAAIEKSSGDPAFDAAALAMLHRADPVPAPPPAVADESLTFTLPVMFRANGK